MTSHRNILTLPFRRTNALNLSDALKKYISTKYDQHPDMFTADLSTVDSLRKSAVAIREPHPSGILKLQSYAAQLVWLGGKFPIDVGADFVWYPALGYHTETAVSQNNLRFELANVLFNLAALYCQLAASSNMSTAEGLKAASNYFCQSAGVISHLKNNVVVDMRGAAPEDMDPMSLECLENLLLAQAQECYWQKAARDGLKDASIAKLAAKVTDLYSDAADAAVKSDSISSEWIHHMTAKHHHFAAAAQFRAACDCLEKNKYGEEVARLRDSLVCANEGLKESRYINAVVTGDLNGLKTKVQEDLKRAERDNDTIYNMPVPQKPELKPLDRASMVSSKVPAEVANPIEKLSEGGPLGKPLFSRLVPYSVHLAASIYASRKDETVKDIINELETLNARIHSLMQSLNLPGSLQALEKPLGLPPGIQQHAEEIRQHDGPARLQRTMDGVVKLKSNARNVYEEGVSLLRSEQAEDDAARRKYGTERWHRPLPHEAANRLYGQIKEFNEYLEKAEAGDATIRQQYREAEPMILLLNDTDRALEDFVPSSRRATVAPRVEKEVSNLRSVLNEVNRMESKRRRSIDALRQKAKQDDIHPDLVKEAARLEREFPMQKIEAVQFEDLFDKRLKDYQVDRDAAKQEQRDQQTLLSRLAEANTCFSTARHGDTSTKDREMALQKLENAYYAYKEIVQNLDVGRKFYNDLMGLVSRFRDECRAFAFQRQSEATQLEADIMTSLPMAKLSLNQPQSPPLAQQNQTQQQSWVDQHPSRSMYRPQTEEPLTAPVPLKPQAAGAAVSNAESAAASSGGMWSPEKGIKFGGPPLSAPHANGAPGTGSKQTTWDPSRGLKFG